MTFTISQEDCEEVLRSKLDEGKQFQIQSWSLDKCSENLIGFFGSHYFLRIACTIDGVRNEFQFFVKYLSTKSDFYNRTSRGKIALYKEHIFLSGIIKDVQKEISKKLCAECYLSKLNQFIVMEDLNQLGFEICKKIFLNIEHVRIAMKTYADFHASFLIYEETKKISIAEKYKNLFVESFVITPKELSKESLFLSMIKGCVALSKKFFHEIPQELSEETVMFAYELCYEKVKPSTKYRNTVLHGDPWSYNMLFKYRAEHPVEAILIDYQVIRYGPPVVDLMQFLNLATSTKIREQYQEELKDIYYNQLSCTLTAKGLNANDILSKDEFHESWLEYQDFGIAIQLFYRYIIHLPFEYFHTTSAEAFLSFLLEGNAELAIKAFENVAEYRELYTEAFQNVLKLFSSKKNIDKM